MMQFKQYFTRDKNSAYFTGVPISKLEEFRNIFPGTFKIRYRGPRNTVADRGRTWHTRQSCCLKQNAVTFTAYKY